MSHAHSHENTVPRPALISAGALIIFVLVLTAAVRLGVLNREAVPEVNRAEASIAAVETRKLTFADQADGAVLVEDSETGEQVALIETETPGGGFVRGVLRGMARERRARGVDATPPFKLTLWQDGSISLVDPATERAVELGGFGPDNRAVFERLLLMTEGQP